jgi:hypothetical protein
VEGGSPSCCAAARGSTIRTTPAPPSGTATIRTLTTPTLASVPAASPPQHPSPSEPLEGIPAGVPEGSRPAPVIGDPRWLGLPRASDRTIRTAPAHCPMALVTWVIRWAFAALTLTPPPPRQGRLAAAAPAARPRCAAPAGSALRGQQSNRAAIAAPSGDRPSPAGARCRWREGKPWWYREGQRPCSPEGHPPPNPIRIPGPLTTEAARAQRGHGGRSAEWESLVGALDGEPRSWWGNRGAAAGAPSFTGSLPLWGQLCSGYASDGSPPRPGSGAELSERLCCVQKTEGRRAA